MPFVRPPTLAGAVRMDDMAAATDRGFDLLGFAAQIDGAGSRQIDIQRVLWCDLDLSAALDIDIDGLGGEIAQFQKKWYIAKLSEFDQGKRQTQKVLELQAAELNIPGPQQCKILEGAAPRQGHIDAVELVHVKIAVAVKANQPVLDAYMRNDVRRALDHQLIAASGLVMHIGGKRHGGAVAIAVPRQAAAGGGRHGLRHGIATRQIGEAGQVGAENGGAEGTSAQRESTSQADSGNGKSGHSDDRELCAHINLSLFVRNRAGGNAALRN